MKKLYRFISLLLCSVLLAVSALSAMPATASASSKTPVISITVSGSHMLLKGKSLTLTTSVYPSNASSKVKFSSSNKDVATISSKGKVTGKKQGCAAITVTATDGSGVSEKFYVQVIDTSKTYVSRFTENLDDVSAMFSSSSTSGTPFGYAFFDYFYYLAAIKKKAGASISLST